MQSLEIQWVGAMIFFLITECLLNPVSATKVYLDRYGDCFHDSYFPVEARDEFSILSHGGEAFDTLRCEITFKSEQNDRLCLHFQRFYIRRCDVRFEVYSQQSASGKVLGSYNCHTVDIPESLCGEGRYLTILFHKKELGHNGYDFSMELQEMTQSDAFRQGFDAFFMSVGVIIAIVAGVIAVVVISAVAIICCCCSKRHKGLVYRQTSKSAPNAPGQDGGPVEPSAPPYPADEAPPTYSEPPPPYSSSQEASSPTAPPTEEKAYV